MFDQITILGPGLLGASIGLAVKERGLGRRIVSWSRRAQTRANCLHQPWCDQVFETPAAASEGSGLVILCTPVQTIVPLLGEIAGSLKETSLVTDVGSTKSEICRGALGVDLNGAGFVGSHPMAGSEQTGMQHARSNLFENAACILTPMPESDPHAVAQIGQFWKSLGMQITHASPEQHDELVAHISHLPHLLASMLCSFLGSKDHSWQALAGGGLRDTTRVAAGDPGLWQQIIESNREEVLRALSGFEEELHRFKSSLVNGDTPMLYQQLLRGKSYRDHLKH